MSLHTQTCDMRAQAMGLKEVGVCVPTSRDSVPVVHVRILPKQEFHNYRTSLNDQTEWTQNELPS